MQAESSACGEATLCHHPVQPSYARNLKTQERRLESRRQAESQPPLCCEKFFGNTQQRAQPDSLRARKDLLIATEAAVLPKPAQAPPEMAKRTITGGQLVARALKRL
jgi:hypothetical protein